MKRIPNKAKIIPLILLVGKICTVNLDAREVEINYFDFCSTMMPISTHLDYKQDNTINCASVVCDTKSKQPVRRSSSTRGKSTLTGKII